MPGDAKSEVSVILPLYNRENSIRASISSVLAQTFQDWELIIVDDCSTDNSFNVASSFKDPRIRVVKSEKNEGAASARNLGIRKAKGIYISFLDSDDAYEPRFLEESVKKLESSSPHIGICWTGYNLLRHVNGQTKQHQYMWKPSKGRPAYFSFLSDLRVGTNSGITIKREVFDQVGIFDESLPAAEDTDLFLRISQQFSFEYVDDYLININQTGTDRLSKRFDKIAQAYNIIISKHLAEIEKHKTLRLKYFYKSMWLNYHLGMRDAARNYFRKVLADNLLHVQGWLIFLLFEIMGKKLGTKIHIRLSTATK